MQHRAPQSIPAGSDKRRKGSIFLVSILLAGSLPLTPLLSTVAQATATVYQDSFDSPALPGWTLSGVLAAQDCALAVGGCSLNVTSRVSGGAAAGDHDLAVNFTAVPYKTTILFRTQAFSPWTQGWETINFFGGGSLRLDFGAGILYNGLALSNGSTLALVGNYTPGSWYKAVINVDPATYQASAELRTLGGAFIARSANLTLPNTVTGFSHVTLAETYSGSNPISQPPVSMNFDNFTAEVATPPSPPTASATGGPGAGQVTVSWTPPTDDGGAPVTGYSVYGASSPGNESLLANVSASTTTYADSGLGNGVWRYYTVTAKNVAGQGNASNEAAARTFTTPTAPQGLTASPGAAPGQVSLRWQAPADLGGAGASILNYSIYRGTNASSLALVTRTTGAPLTFTDTNRQNGTTYSYAVTATNVVGEGPQSTVASSKPASDQASRPTSAVIYPSTGWTGDARSVNFTYSVTVSECDPSLTCPVSNDWRVLLDGTPGALDGTPLASGTNSHPGNAQTVTYGVSASTVPSGTDGDHLLKIAVNARSQSTQWNVTNTTIHIDAPVPGWLSGPSTPQLNNSTTTGNVTIQVNASYAVFQKQCRPTDACAIPNDWRILLDGTNSTSPDGLLLDNGTNTHPAHGETLTNVVNRSVFIPRLSPGPHYLKVAARSDANASWRVSYTLLSGVIFSPNLDDANYDTTAGGAPYAVTNAAHGIVWSEGPAPDLPSAGHAGVDVWATNLAGQYPPLAAGTLRVAQFDLTGATHATLALDTLFATADTYDLGQVFVVANGIRTLVEPTSGPAYATSIDGARGWMGASDGWAAATFDLTPFVGQVVSIQFEFRSDALNEGRGWFLDDLSVTKDSIVLLSDSLENAWSKDGGWTLAQPTTGPQGGSGTTHAWAIAPFAPYAPAIASHLQLPVLDLSGVQTATLTFQQWFKTEYGPDAGHVEVSPDGGRTWRTIAPVAGLLYDQLPDGSSGWSGNSLGWKSSTFELTPYAGANLYFRFVFSADDIVQNDGWYISDFLMTATSPGPVPLPAFGSHATSGDAFYAYFERTGASASVTTPSGETTTITYQGTTGDVVARLAADGTLTARKAVVIGSPTSVPATDFTITGHGFMNTPSSGTWIIRGAPSLAGVGGTQLDVGGKTFDDAAAASEPIDTTGNGHVSASNRATLSWNYHDQSASRYDTTLTSQTTDVETQLDTRLRYEPDADLDGFSDKAELRGNSDPTNALSTPFTDDDADGVPNAIEVSRLAATDPFATLVNPLLSGTLLGTDWEHASMSSAAAAAPVGQTLHDSDGDGIPDYLDLTNDPTEATFSVSADNSQNALTFSAPGVGYQIAIVITPDWRNVVLVEVGNSTSVAGPTSLTYDQFFNELSGYYGATHYDAVGQVDQLLNATLRQHLDSTMQFTLVRTTAGVGQVGLSFLAGAGGDGTWTIVRDADLQSLSLKIDGKTVDASFTAPLLPTLPAIGILHTSWFFLNMQDAVPGGYDDKTQCITYNVFFRDGSCAQFPTTTGMRLFGANATLTMRGLLTQLRVQYAAASLAPQIFQIVQQQVPASPAAAAAAPASSKWFGGPTTDTFTNGTTSLAIAQGTLARADATSPTPRAFNWEFQWAPIDPHVGIRPTMQLSIEPADGSTTGSTVIVSGSVMRDLGFDPTAYQPPQFDAAHQAGTTVTWTDADGDGVKDYVITFAHFSKAWAMWTILNGPTNGDFSVLSSTRAFVVLGSNSNVYVWDGNGWQSITRVPSDTLNSHFQGNAVSAAGTNEAWFAGGNDCTSSTGLGWILRLTYNPSNPLSSVWTEWQFPSGSSCGVFYDIDALSSSNVWAAGIQGIYHWNGATWSLTGGSPPATHVQFFNANDGYAITALQGFEKGVWHWSPQNQQWSGGSPTLPFIPSTHPSGFQLDATRAILWTTGVNSLRASYCTDPCTSFTSLTYPAGADFVPLGIYGHDSGDAWAVGKTSTGAPAMYRYGAGAWAPWTTGVTQADSELDGIGFADKTEGWTMDRNGHVFHYSGSNSAPSASFTKDHTTATTNDVVNADGRASSDPDGDPLTYSWTWGDGTAGDSTPTASHRYRASGTYTISLTVTDTQGVQNTQSQTITVTDFPLTSGTPVTQSFTAPGQQDYYVINVPSGQDQLAVALSGPSGQNFDLYMRLGAEPSTSTFDNSSTSAGATESISRTPIASGAWYILVRDQTGAGSYTLTATYRAKPTAPTIAQSPLPQLPGQSTTLSGSSTASSPISYTINWGDGQSTPVGPLASGATYSSSHSYVTVGDYAATVTAADQFGLSNTNALTVQVRNVASGTTDPAQAVGQTTATLAGTLSDLGGYASTDTWFEYGLTTSYGTNTTTITRSNIASFTQPISSLQTNSLYHFRLTMHDGMGYSHGIDRTLNTVDNAPLTPSLSTSLAVSSRSEVVWANGSATDPEGDTIFYTIAWGDGATNTTSSVPSGTPYSVQHAFANYGTYTISVTATDAVNVVSSPTSQPHDVADFPSGTTSSASGIGRTIATLNANVTSLGGDPAGVTGWFEYGLQGNGFPSATPHVTYASLQAVSIPVIGLTEGGQYQYRFVTHNERGTTTASTVNFVTNTRPTLQALDLFPNNAYEDTRVTFETLYADKDNEAPGSGYPQVTIDGVAHALTQVVATSSYAAGATYSYTTMLPAGQHPYSYQWTDSLPDVQSRLGRQALITVYRDAAWHDPINKNSAANGLPSPAWARTGTVPPTGPYWHTVNTPNVDRLADAPDWPAPGSGAPASVSLWFGDDATGTYDNSSTQSFGSVLTPDLDLTGAKNPSLHFWSYFETQDGGTRNDTKKAYVVDAQHHETLLATLAGPYAGDHQWWPVSLDLSLWAGQHVRVRFEFDSVDGNANHYRGWYLNEMTLGTDRDGDGIADVAERGDQFLTTWTSVDGLARIGPGQSVSSHQWGIQYSYTDLLVASVGISTPDCQLRVVVNTSDWSTTAMNGSCAPSSWGTGTTHRQENGAIILTTDLIAAGYHPKSLESPQNVTVTVTELGSSTVTQFGYLLTAGGETQATLPDTDGDGLKDGKEINHVGTDPLSRDPDNDGYNDGIDQRPYTPDDPPAIRVDKGDGSWPTTLSASAVSRWGIQDVRAVFTGSGGSRELTSPTKLDAQTWEWHFPTDLGQVQRVTINANDSFHNDIQLLVTYDAHQVPATAKTNFMVFAEGGAAFMTVTEGAVETIGGGGALCVSPAAEACAAGAAFVAGVALGALIVTIVQDSTSSPGTVTRVEQSTRYSYDPRYQGSGGIVHDWLFTDYGIAAGSFDCATKLRLVAGVDVSYAHRGANGILGAYSTAYDPQGYNTISNVQSAIGNELQTGVRIYQLDAYSGMMLFVDSTHGFIDRWQLALDKHDPANCLAEIQYENRYPLQNLADWDQIIQRYGPWLAVAFALAVIDHEIDAHPESPANVHLIDAKSNYAEVETFQASDVPKEFNSAFWRWFCEGSTGARAFCDGGGLSTTEGKYANAVAETVTRQAQVKARSFPNTYLPTWYWWNTTAPNRRGDFGVSPNTIPLDNATFGTFLVDDASPTTDAYNDLGTASVKGANPQTVPPIDQDMLGAEQQICSWKAAHPASRFATMPMVITRTDPVEIYIEMADSTSAFGYGGRC